MSQSIPVLVTGAGGFIGHHLVKFLKAKGYWVRGVDIKQPEFEASDADEFELLDLRRWASCLEAVRPADIGGERQPIQHVYALAADMGGMGFISKYHAEILHNNILINTHTMEAAKQAGVTRYLYTSSACVYPEYLQTEAEVTPLKEDDAYPAQPQDAYGWEKLITEQLAFHYRKQYGIETRTVRFHNVYGELGTWEGGREKAPAAMMRKVAYAKLLGGREGQPGGEPQVEIWGDGEQTRSFMHVDDCVEGVYRIMMGDYAEPLNLGRDRMVTINKLADIVADAAGIDIEHVHVDGPMGVRGRNSDNDLLRQTLGWEPQIALEDGIARTYAWIEQEVRAKLVREGVLSASGDGAQAEAALAR
ncbi:MAG: NAD-dependent epimerase/dehydratase family protein [Bacteroidota bacterium]